MITVTYLSYFGDVAPGVLVDTDHPHPLEVGQVDQQLAEDGEFVRCVRLVS